MRLIECRQYDDRWWEVRRGVPTASEFGNIITAKEGKFAAASRSYAYQLIADKYRWDYGPQSQFATISMIEGSKMEPEARAYYEFQRSCDVQEVGFAFTDCGRFGASPDALVGEDGALELKSPKAKTHIEYLIGGSLPDDYKAQVHGQLIVTGRSWVDFMSYCPGLPKFLVRVEPDEFTEKLRGYLEQFWTLYQDLLAKIVTQREEAIDEAIARKGDQLEDNLRALVPPVMEESYF